MRRSTLAPSRTRSMSGACRDIGPAVLRCTQPSHPYRAPAVCIHPCHTAQPAHGRLVVNYLLTGQSCRAVVVVELSQWVVM